MNKMKKIIVATDFSDHSDNAINVAHLIQKDLGCQVVVAHISDVSPVWDWPATDMQAKNLLAQFQKDINTSIENSLKEQMKRCNVNFESIIKFGDTQSELTKIIQSTQADLLVLGHRGKTGLFGMGSFAIKMIASSPIPVLVAKNDDQITRIGCLVDPSKISQESISFTQEYASHLNAKPLFMSFVPDLTSEYLMNSSFVMPSYRFSEEEKALITEKVKKSILERTKSLTQSDIHIEISSASPARALSKALRTNNVDLAIVSRHNRGPVEKFLIGSTSKSILQEFEGNILVLPN